MPRLSFALENLKNIQEMIRFADTKAGAVLVVYGFLITIYIEIGKTLSLAMYNITEFGIVTFVIGGVSGILLLHELMYLFLKVLRPRLAKGYDKESKCIYYFEHIAGCTKSDIVQSIMNTDEENMVAEIATQIHENAKILTRKLSAISSAIYRLIASGVLIATFGIAAKVLEIVK